MPCGYIDRKKGSRHREMSDNALRAVNIKSDGGAR